MYTLSCSDNVIDVILKSGRWKPGCSFVNRMPSSSCVARSYQPSFARWQSLARLCPSSAPLRISSSLLRPMNERLWNNNVVRGKNMSHRERPSNLLAAENDWLVMGDGLLGSWTKVSDSRPCERADVAQSCFVSKRYQGIKPVNAHPNYPAKHACSARKCIATSSQAAVHDAPSR